MFRKKAESFDATSNLNLTDMEKRVDGRSNLQADWARYHTLSPRINGKPFAQYYDQYNQFQTQADVKHFFEEVLLAGVSLGANEKQEAVNFLLTYFRQKGFMQPVMTMLERTALVESKSKEHEYQFSSNYTEQQIDIITTDKGFTLQEIATVTKLNRTEKTSGNTVRLEQSEGSKTPYLVKAQGTIDFNFSHNPSAPEMTVQSNFISYGHSEVQALLDKRNFLQKFIEFIISLFGGLKVDVHEYVEPEAPQADDDHNMRMGGGKM